MNEYPRMLYRAGGVEEIHGGHFDTLIVQDDDAEADALDAGWSLTTTEALPDASTGDDAPPTRAELKAKLAELGIGYARTATDARLSELIAAAMAEAA